MRCIAMLVFLCLPTLSMAASITESAPKRLERLIAFRQSLLESYSGILCDPVTPTVIQFGVPSDIHPARTYDFGARYQPSSRSFLFNPKYYAALNRWHGDSSNELMTFLLAEESLRSAIDHEVGHALVFDIAQRSGQLDWYLPSALAEMTSDQKIGMKILTEGLGTYFERLLLEERTPHGRAIMPANWQDPNWSSRFNEICYESGYSIVAEIVDTYGERGIIYILAHPLFIPDGDLYSAAMEYETVALTALRQPTR